MSIKTATNGLKVDVIIKKKHSFSVHEHGMTAVLAPAPLLLLLLLRVTGTRTRAVHTHFLAKSQSKVIDSNASHLFGDGRHTGPQLHVGMS